MADYLLAKTGSQIDARLDDPLPVSLGGTGFGERSVDLTVTADTSVVSNHSITVRLFPYLGMCFVRGTVKFDSVAVPAGTWVALATVAPGFRPLYRTALAATLGDCIPISSRIRNDGVIELAVSDAIRATRAYYAYFSGWWMVPPSTPNT